MILTLFSQTRIHLLSIALLLTITPVIQADFALDTRSEIEALTDKKITPEQDTSAEASTSESASEGQEKLFVPVNTLDTLTDNVKQQINQICAVLLRLSIMINNGEIKTLDNKKATLENLKVLTSTIEGLKQERFANSNNDPMSVQMLQQLNNELLTHLIKALDGTFRHLPAFSPSMLHRSTKPAKMTLAEMKKAGAENDRLIQVLFKRADSAGLRWYNHIYRSLDSYVLTPSYKYSVPQRTALSLAVASIGCIAWRAAYPDSFKDTFNRGPLWPIWSFFGEQAKFTNNLGNSQCENFDKLHPFGKLEYVINSNLSPSSILIATGLGALIFHKGIAEWTDNIYPWIYKKVDSIHNRLKGGSCLKEARRLEGAVEEVTFKDLVGLDHVKREFSVLLSYLENPESFDRAGLTPPKGILLVGETRTGKSHSVKALFTEIKQMLKRKGKPNAFKFFNFDASKIHLWGINRIVNIVQHEAPCILFIDEIDLLSLQRRGDQTTLSEFLQCMSGALSPTDPKNQVIIIAATNKPENIDSALRQYGRFGKEIRFEYPTLDDRRSFIRKKIEKLSLNTSLFDVERMAQETEDMSYEALNTLITSALTRARLRGRSLTQADVEAALDAELRSIAEGTNKRLPEHEKRIISVHLAGKAIALRNLDIHTKLAKVTIRPVMTKIEEQFIGAELVKDDKFKQQQRFEPGYIFTFHENDTMNIKTQEEKRRLCQFHVAGDVAEELIFGSSSYSCGKGSDDALPIALSIACEGMDYYKLPPHAQKKRFNEALELIASCKKDVLTLLKKHRKNIEKLAQELQDKESLNAKEVTDVLDESKQK